MTPDSSPGSSAQVVVPSRSTTTVVTQSPPSPQDEIQAPRPSSRHVWIAGYWTWSNESYVWKTGSWELPPYANARWIAPYWEREGNAYRFYEGRWD